MDRVLLLWSFDRVFINVEEMIIAYSKETLTSDLVLERQLDECLESLEREREEKMSLRRELHELADRENLPRTPSREAQNGSICPDSPSGDSTSSTEARQLRDRLRNQGQWPISLAFLWLDMKCKIKLQNALKWKKNHFYGSLKKRPKWRWFGPGPRERLNDSNAKTLV